MSRQTDLTWTSASQPVTSAVAIPTRADADAVFASIPPGGRAVGLTKGQLSMIDFIRSALKRTGPARVVISTWTAGIRDLEASQWLLEEGAITDLQLLVDRSFPGRQPRYAKRLIDLFGPAAVWCTRTHAKFALIEGELEKLTIVGSMNLNKNPRFESFSIDTLPEIHAFYLGLVREIQANVTAGFETISSEVEAGFAAALMGADLGAERKARIAARASCLAPRESAEEDHSDIDFPPLDIDFPPLDMDD